MSRRADSLVVTGLIAISLGLVGAPVKSQRQGSPAGTTWTPEERKTLKSLTLSSLPPLPPDPSNRHADDSAAARLGARLFFETRLSSNGQVSCASCHMPGQDFQDGRPLGVGVGTGSRRTMPIAGTAYSPWLFWDGRADSQWGQALGPMESAVEHGGDRVTYARVIAANYSRMYQAVFGPLPSLRGLPEHAGPVADTVRRQAWAHIAVVRQVEVSRLYANIGKAIAAYERQIHFTPSRFDRYVDAELAGRTHTPSDDLSSDEQAGLRLFIGKANCATCHNGPLFTDDAFHNTGVPASAGAPLSDSGRAVGVRLALAGEFNCLSTYSDAKPEDCSELRFAVTSGPLLLRAFKTPSLRNASVRPPFMHAGQFRTLTDVLDHYNRAPAAPAGKSELKPLRLNETELRQLVAFLSTLVSPLDVPSAPAPRHDQ